MAPHAVVAALIICAASCVTSNADRPLFGKPVILLRNPTGSCTAGDFNNDGRSEFVVAARQLLMFIWNPDTHQMDQVAIAPARIPGTPGKGNRYGGDLAVADIDGDGLLDIVVPNSNNKLGPGSVIWYRNPGKISPNWQPATVTTWPGSGEKTADNYVRHMSEIEAGDIDGDDDADIVTRDVQFGLFVLRNDGDGNWIRRHIPVNPREGLALYDLDHDGDLDIVINGIWLETPGTPSHPADLLTAQFIQHSYDRDDDNGDNQYPSDNNRFTQNAYAKKVKLGDMNGDGRADIIVSNAEQLGRPGISGGPKGIRIYLSPAPENLFDPWREIILTEPTVKLQERFSLHTLEIGDLDRDGDLDILSAVSPVGSDRAPGRIFALLNDGSGEHFTLRPVFNQHAYNNVIADADGDGDLDLFGGENFPGGDVRYFENLTLPRP